MTANHPLRLATGSHEAGSGKGCAMNVISWENGDTRITDMPACADRVLARIVQKVNDTICTHRNGDLLCPDCSQLVLDLAHRTVGTGGPVDLERKRVWTRVAVDQARQVLHLAANPAVAEKAIAVAEAWAEDPSQKTAHDAYAAYAVYAVDATAAAAHAAAAHAATAADIAATASVDASDDETVRLTLAHRAIDVFQQWTGHTNPAPDPNRTAAAYTAMTSVEM